MYYILMTNKQRKLYYFGGVQINMAEHLSQDIYEKCRQTNRDSCWFRVNDDGSRTKMPEQINQ